MSQKLDIIQWCHQLKRASHDMIIADDILEKAPPLFRKCEALATKKDGICYDCDKGAFTLQAELFNSCLFHQFDQVELLFLEYFPPMSPKWRLHKEIWMYRLLMYKRFQLNDAKIRELCNQLENRIRSGRIQSVQSRIYEHWLLPED